MSKKISPSDIRGMENIKKAPLLFTGLACVSTASYVLCTPLMVKVIAFEPTSIFSMLGMMTFAFLGTILGDRVRKITGNKTTGMVLGVLLAVIGILIWYLEAIDIFHLPGPVLESSFTGDSIFFTLTYVLSDVFSEVFGYKASRFTGNLNAIFSVIVGLICKGMTMIPVPDWAEPNEQAFDFIYGGGVYITVIGVLIYMFGDWANDFVFRKIKEKKDDDTFGSYSMRAIGSSFIGKSVDLLLFSLLVMVPLSTPSICEALGIASWGMTPALLVGNYILGVSSQITLEVALIPISYVITQRVLKIINKDKPTIQVSSKSISLNS